MKMVIEPHISATSAGNSLPQEYWIVEQCDVSGVLDLYRQYRLYPHASG
jgi:hypothetical protein